MKKSVVSVIFISLGSLSTFMLNAKILTEVLSRRGCDWYQLIKFECAEYLSPENLRCSPWK